ncbi:MAG: GHKL domain-containing protein [Candidatus Hydrogenedentes bacterium]|nr:GHKL domain-containing protein [Candidatus Hydrogenedentota bacterium]
MSDKVPQPDALSEPVRNRMDTLHAPAGRADPEALRALASAALADPIVQVVLEAVNGYLLILDQHRQIIAANDTLLHALGLRSPEEMLGLRPGELLHCENAHLGPGGCGTSRKCGKCGAVLTILSCQNSGEPAEGECSLTMENDGELKAADFHVRCTPITLAGEPVMAFVLQDISSEKRRDVLEKVFMHDLRNVLQGLMGFSELMDTGDASFASHMILALSNQLNEEVEGQECLMKAERGELDVNYASVDAGAILEQVREVFEHHPSSRGKFLRVLCLSSETRLESDARLLRRVLINMTKNAFEAVAKGETVKLRFEQMDGTSIFSVWNPGYIPESVAAQIFQRSFTTKGEQGRGIGTYSMRLLGNQYLGGHVYFTTSEAEGTEFSIRIPRTLNPSANGR